MMTVAPAAVLKHRYNANIVGYRMGNDNTTGIALINDR
jgi:hypothetical protein